MTDRRAIAHRIDQAVRAASCTECDGLGVVDARTVDKPTPLEAMLERLAAVADRQLSFVFDMAPETRTATDWAQLLQAEPDQPTGARYVAALLADLPPTPALTETLARYLGDCAP